MNVIAKRSIFASTRIHELINFSYQQKVITKARAKALHIEYQQLLSTLVLDYTHLASTSVHRKTFINLMHSCDYILQHTELNPVYMQLSTYSIHELYKQGIKHLQKDTVIIEQLVDSLQNFCLFQNERYLDVLYHQFPNYLSLIKCKAAHFYYHQTKEDFDYPLLDGIPLFQNMYRRKGTDLAIEYLRRFSIEQQFCLRFQEELPAFLKQYEQLKGISPLEIHINIFEIMLYQCMANNILYKRSSLMLTQSDIVRLKSILQYHPLDLFSTFKHLATHDDALFQYLLLHKEIIGNEWNKFVNSDYELFIYEQSDQMLRQVILHRTSKDLFKKYLFDLEGISSIEEKLSYIKEHEIDVYDMFDLLEQNIFYNEEYTLYFQTLTTLELCIFLKLLASDLVAFHQVTFSAILEVLDEQTEWQAALTSYLIVQTDTIKEQLVNAITYTSIK